ncbi:lipoprotein [Geotalea uraniireducens]|uniref:Lipoprotein n=1 Tax=Geotalea uraniireducens TaxID=351604 RepID=A0ABM8EHD1_9BACT|nr:nuclear transport factor 2 family protein [Geotalea uraniireducens]BDV41665.1 lipoprotein [Geotalea uraniireducens]
MRPLILLLLFALMGCSADKRAIDDVLQKREQALAKGDSSLYATLISPAYRDDKTDAAGKRAELAKTLQRIGPVSYRSLSRTITVKGDTATVEGRYAMKIPLKGTPLELAGEETIRLRRETGGWKIVSGL